MKKIVIVLPADRWNYGTLSVIETDTPDAAPLLGPCAVDGKADDSAAQAHGNPTRNPAKAFGDTPLGDYVGTLGHVPNTPSDRRSYGEQDATGSIPVIWLQPIRGDGTSQAWQRQLSEGEGVNMGLAIHSGALNGSNGLRPTFGCCRTIQCDQTKLVALMAGPANFLVSIQQKA